MGDPAFEVQFGCRNCGGQWFDQFLPRTNVTDGGSTKDVKVRNEDCDIFGTINCDCCYAVECPTCELRGDVFVGGREPIVEDSNV